MLDSNAIQQLLDALKTLKADNATLEETQMARQGFVNLLFDKIDQQAIEKMDYDQAMALSEEMMKVLNFLGEARNILKVSYKELFTNIDGHSSNSLTDINKAIEKRLSALSAEKLVNSFTELFNKIKKDYVRYIEFDDNALRNFQASIVELIKTQQNLLKLHSTVITEDIQSEIKTIADTVQKHRDNLTQQRMLQVLRTIFDKLKAIDSPALEQFASLKETVKEIYKHNETINSTYTLNTHQGITDAIKKLITEAERLENFMKTREEIIALPSQWIKLALKQDEPLLRADHRKTLIEDIEKLTGTDLFTQTYCNLNKEGMSQLENNMYHKINGAIKQKGGGICSCSSLTFVYKPNKMDLKDVITDIGQNQKHKKPQRVNTLKTL